MIFRNDTVLRVYPDDSYLLMSALPAHFTDGRALDEGLRVVTAEELEAADSEESPAEDLF